MNSTCPAAPPDLLLQPLWESILRRERLLQSPLLPASFGFLAHLALSVPFLLVDVLGRRWPQMNCYRIAGGDPQVPVGDTLQLWGRCLLRIACCHLTVIAPVTALLQCVRSPSLPPEAPRCARALAEVALCLLLFDSVYFAWHVVIHRVPWLYQRVHSTHHQNRDTFALAAQDSSPWELLSLQTIALTCAALLDCHPLSEMAFHMINIWMSVEDHCGHDLPWATHRLLPFHLLGGSPFHQTHHHHFRYNYAPYFTHWDRLCGTYRADTAEKP